MDTIQFAVAAAVHAPSVHNTQPWRFGHGERDIDVCADAGRRLRVADPAGRELMISCCAAVFTLRVALRYLGWLPRASLFPDPSRPALVARVRWDEDRIAADAYEREMYAAVTARHTHRGGFGSAPLPAGTLAALRAEAAREGAMLRVVAVGDQRDALAAAVQAGEHALRLDANRAAELADWVVAPDSPRRDGIPPAAYPAEPGHTEPDFPGRDFAAGKGWGLAATAAGERSSGVVCLLATSANEPADWVVAGQALQRVLLRATACGVATALHSQPLELPQLRDFIRVQLAARAHPQMIIRLGVTGQAGTGGSIRRPVGDVLL
jgi:nitroreductase